MHFLIAFVCFRRVPPPHPPLQTPQQVRPRDETCFPLCYLHNVQLVCQADIQRCPKQRCSLSVALELHGSTSIGQIGRNGLKSACVPACVLSSFRFRLRHHCYANWEMAMRHILVSSRTNVGGHLTPNHLVHPCMEAFWFQHLTPTADPGPESGRAP